ncbi:ferritin-like domain-containing protein [Zobellella aerophila]|uniref:Ferritin-like domain-containing protein n=1 Tax=Zobellella aerophila TaxID=870480 RepID=A0ABP6W1A1_9GAMM
MNKPEQLIISPRRRFLFDGLCLTLSGAAIGLLAGKPRLALATEAGSEAQQTDIRILGTAWLAEREAIAAYQLGADSGLLQAEAFKVAVSFQGHHREHAELLAGTIDQLGGKLPASPADYAFPVDRLNNQADVLAFAAGLERGAVSAYAGAIPLFDNRELASAAASILADEAMHWAVLRSALGMDPVPGAFFS